MLEEALMSLVAASSKFIGQLDREELISRILTEADRAVAASSSSIILRSSDTEELFFYAATGRHGDRLQRVAFDAKSGVAGDVLRTGEPALVLDAAKDPRHYDRIDAISGVRTESLICVPVRVEGEVIGVLEAINSRKPGGFTPEDLRLLEVLATFAGAAIRNAGQFRRTRLQAEGFRSAADRWEAFVGRSPAMRTVWETAIKAAETNCTILLTGESGVGKEVVASFIWRRSPRAEGPFVCVNCAALDENLLNSELFGHEAGAFTGATSRKIGRFELAHEGTLFFDEITECSPGTQARLLRVLQEQRFERLGGTEPIRTDARLIAATNADIEELVRSHRFREDLYHRLDVVRIHVPPLRERLEEVPHLMRHCLEAFAKEMNRPLLELETAALERLRRYDWPGNVRELKNLAERMMVLHERSTVTERDLDAFMPPSARSRAAEEAAAPTPRQVSSLPEEEKRLITEALKANAWNQSAAARSLGIERHHLRYRIRKYGIVLRPRE